MTTKTTSITSDCKISTGRLCRFGYTPGCDLWMPSIVINYGARYFRHSPTRWERIEDGRRFGLTGDVLAIAEKMHADHGRA
jgi:hypothetical protein